MAATGDRGQKIVENILKNPGNNSCVDCGALGNQLITFKSILHFRCAVWKINVYLPSRGSAWIYPRNVIRWLLNDIMWKYFSMSDREHSSDCSWASTTLGCFVCIRCSGIHRLLYIFTVPYMMTNELSRFNNNHLNWNVVTQFDRDKGFEDCSENCQPDTTT